MNKRFFFKITYPEGADPYVIRKAAEEHLSLYLFKSCDVNNWVSKSDIFLKNGNILSSECSTYSNLAIHIKTSLFEKRWDRLQDIIAGAILELFIEKTSKVAPNLSEELQKNKPKKSHTIYNRIDKYVHMMISRSYEKQRGDSSARLSLVKIFEIYSCSLATDDTVFSRMNPPPSLEYPAINLSNPEYASEAIYVVDIHL